MAATQETQSTQQRLDPRRLGRNNSGLSAQDVSDVVCVLHPSSQAALRIVAVTAQRNPQHVLQNQGMGLTDENGDMLAPSEADTILIRSQTSNRPLDLALRFSSHVSDPTMGFCFGRNQYKCDINLDPDEHNRRVSNVHFRIYLNENGVLMLEDVSTNGTVVNHIQLGGKRHPENPSSRMLETGAIIEVLNPVPDDAVKFVLRIPSRDNFFDSYQAKFQAYMDHVHVAKQRAQNAKHGGLHMTDAATRAVLAAPLAGPVNPKVIPTTSLPKISNFGMHWDGGGKYNCIGLLGKGAFATVYQIATVFAGELFAAKELDKRRFVKNGQLDVRIDTEMRIMQGISHASIVKFIEYEETKSHLYLVMEFVPGGDLQGYMQSHATLPEDKAQDMTRQILDALQYLHSQNITHRDIKPDNILIASEDPFVVKLTDFGLSKVVRNNETFLKTFCGTLLYCAPEVFPHYDNWVANKRPKRRRRDMNSGKHTYGQSVDVWSYAAVLWTSLCGKPPFEGVVDANGKGMFERIMSIPLDKTPLLECGVSDDACDFLFLMLDTDPTSRPSESECLRHPWLNDGQWILDPEEEAATGMGPITEEVEEDLDASQLSIHDLDEQQASGGSNESETQPHTKRLRGQFDPDQTPRLGYHFETVPIVHEGSEQGRQFPSTMPEFRPPKLFGEISQPALQSSGALGAAAVDHYAPQQGSFAHSSNDSSYGDSAILNMEYELSGPVPGIDGHDIHSRRPQRAGAQPSLTGAESMVRELNMHSPHGGRSVAVTPDGPRTPERDIDDAEQNQKTSGDAAGPTPKQTGKKASQDKKVSQEETPRPRRPGHIDRQIHLPITASAYYNPYDESTHNIEYASRVSGHDFAAEPAASEDAVKSLPSEVQASFHNPSARRASTGQQATSGATEPAAQNGSTPFALLTSTSNSFTRLTIPVTKRITTWGRNSSCDVVYSPMTDTRVPKVGLELIFDAPGVVAAGDDWPVMPSLKLLLLTKASNGVWVNGTRLPAQDADGRRAYGRLAHGDIIDVFRPRSGLSDSSGASGGTSGEEMEQPLSFRVEIGIEAARWERGTKAFEVLSTD